MIPHSAELDEVIASGSIITAQRGTIYRGGSVLLGPDELTIQPSPTITFDEDAVSVRTFNGSFVNADGSLTPLLADDPLSVYGNELFYEVGVWIPSLGDYEWLPMGMYRIFANETTTSRLITVTGYERSTRIAAARNEEPYVISGGSLYKAINDYIQAKYPGIPFTADPDAAGTSLIGGPRVYQEGSIDGDPWQNVRDLARQYGRYLDIDEVGGSVLSRVVDPLDQEVTWDYVTGESNLANAGAIPTDFSVVRNVWVVSGEGPDFTPVRATAEITDPADPLYAGVGSLVGRIPEFYTSSFLASIADAQAMADAMKTRAVGVGQGRSFTAAPHPAHLPRDVIHYQSDLLGTDNLLALSKWTLETSLMVNVNYTTRLVA